MRINPLLHELHRELGDNWSAISRALWQRHGIEMSRDTVRRHIQKMPESATPATPSPWAMTPNEPQQEERGAEELERALAKMERQVAVLKDERTHLIRRLKASQLDGGLFESMAATIRAHTEPVEPLPSPPPRAGRPAQTPVDFVLLLSDEHADEIVTREATWGMERFDFDVFRVRLTRLRDIVRDYATIHLPAHNAERLWVFKLGDANHGPIHGNKLRNHFRNSLKAALATGDAEAEFIRSLVPYFPGGVHVVGVSGNHPRQSKEKDYGGPHDNFDYLVGTQIATRLHREIEEGRVSVHLPDSWSAYANVRGKLFCLNHGDDVPAAGGLPWVAFDKRNARVQAMVGATNRHVDIFCYGHYHTQATLRTGGGLSVHNGAFPFTDDYAINKVAAGGEPMQQLLVVGDKPGVRGLLSMIPIYLRSERRESPFSADEALGGESVVDLVEPMAPYGASQRLQIVEAA